MIITVNYIANYRLNFAPNYVFTKCGLCYNLKSGKLIKQVLKGSTIGYIVNSKFISLDKLRPNLENIEKNKCPF
jgi:hypothetical protein